MIMVASPGARGGAGVLGTVDMGAPFFSMDVKSKVSVPRFQDHYDFETGKIINPDIHIQEQIKNALTTVFVKSDNV